MKMQKKVVLVNQHWKVFSLSCDKYLNSNFTNINTPSQGTCSNFDEMKFIFLLKMKRCCRWKPSIYIFQNLMKSQI